MLQGRRQMFSNMGLSLAVAKFINRKSLELDGVNQYMSVGDDSSLSFGNGATDSEFSISAWIRPVDATNFIIAHKDGEYLFYINGSDQLEVRLYDDSASAYIGRSYSSALTSSENLWRHVQFTYTGGGSAANITLYLDGARVDDTDVNSGSYTAMEDLGNALNVGFDDTNYADGRIDQLVIWGDDLSIQELRELITLRDVSLHSAYANVVSWWDFEDDDITGTTVRDKKGSNDGTLQNGATNAVCIPYPYDYQLVGTDTDTVPFEKWGGFMFDFDGVNDYLDLTSDSSLHFSNTDSFSVGAWVEFDSTPTIRLPIINVRNASGFWMLRTDSSGNFNFVVGGSSVVFYEATTSIQAEAGKKYFVVATYDNGTVDILVNGQSVGTQQGSTPTFTTSGAVEAGRAFSTLGTSNNFNGKMDSLFVANDALTPTECATIYNNNLIRQEELESLSSKFVSIWRAYGSQTGSGNVPDLIGSNDGTMNGMTNDRIVYLTPRKVYADIASVSLDATNEHLTVTYDVSLNPQSDDFSMYGWIKFPAGTDNRVIMTIGADDTNENYVGLNINPNKELDVIVRYGASGTRVTYDGTAILSENQWHLCVMSFDFTNDRLKTYVDGVLDGDHNISAVTTIDTSGHDIVIGARGRASGNHDIFGTKQLSDLGFVKGRVLSSCEVQELWNDGSPPVDPNDLTFADDISMHIPIKTTDTIASFSDVVSSNDAVGQNLEAGDIDGEDYPTN